MSDDMDAASQELDELGEVWLENHVVIRRDNAHVDIALAQATRDYRRAEKKERKRLRDNATPKA